MPVQDEILALLALPERGAEAPSVDRLEDTLTEGYARALALDAERLRLERRVGEIAREAGGDRPQELSRELSAISVRIASADGELTRLRTLLDTLHDRARAARAGMRRAS